MKEKIMKIVYELKQERLFIESEKKRCLNIVMDEIKFIEKMNKKLNILSCCIEQLEDYLRE